MNRTQLRNYAFAYQPILGLNQSTVALELLYREPVTQQADIVDDTSATADVIVNSIFHSEMDIFPGQRKMFINVSEGMLLSDMLLLLPRDQVAIELLETIPINRQVIERCHKLKAMGFCLALDDFVCERMGELSPLLDIVDVVKIDLQLNDLSRLSGQIDALRKWQVTLLAEKVETFDDFECCKQMGFSLFQGYYFAKPNIVSGRRIDPVRMAVLKLLGELNRATNDSLIIDTLQKHPGLTFHILRLVNSAAMGAPHKIGSVRQALSVLGRRQLTRWLNLLLFAVGNCGETPPLMELAARRGKFMEFLAQRWGLQFGEHAYMAGVLSPVSALLGLPMKEIVDSLGLIDEISDALLERKGRLGHLLELCELLERADFQGSEEIARQIGIPYAHIMAAQTSALV